MSPITASCLPTLVNEAQAVSPIGGVRCTPAAVTWRSVRGNDTLKTPSFSLIEPFAPVSGSIFAVSIFAAVGAPTSAAIRNASGLHMSLPPLIRGADDCRSPSPLPLEELVEVVERGAGAREPDLVHLERAEVPLVGELAVEHVEPQLSHLVLVLPRGHELEARLLVDEAADE